MHAIDCDYVVMVGSLESALKALTGPVEKEVREFVRLAKWEDRNHYAMAASAEKAHRKLHKFTRKFKVLFTLSTPELITASDSHNYANNTELWK